MLLRNETTRPVAIELPRCAKALVQLALFDGDPCDGDTAHQEKSRDAEDPAGREEQYETHDCNERHVDGMADTAIWASRDKHMVGVESDATTVVRSKCAETRG